MTPPAYTSVERVKDALGIGPYDVVDDTWLELVVDAVNVAVCQWRPDLCWRHCGSCDGGQYTPGQFDPRDFVNEYVTGSGARGTIHHRGRGCSCRCHFPHSGAGGGGLGQFVGTDFVWGEYVTDGGTSSGGAKWYYMGDARVALGATILASRWYKRRGADDVAAYTEFGGPPPAVDKDVESLLEVNRGFRPVVA